MAALVGPLRCDYSLLCASQQVMLHYPTWDELRFYVINWLRQYLIVIYQTCIRGFGKMLQGLFARINSDD